jgi:Protein of unknown function (DUF3618)
MADSTQQQTRDPHEIREDIEQTRTELGETVETLAQKADVKGQATAKVDEVKGRLDDKRAESVDRFKQATPDSAGQAAATVTTKARENRTPLILAGVALGAFLAGRASGRR